MFMFRLIAVIFAWLLSRMVAVTASDVGREKAGWREYTVVHPGVLTSIATYRIPVFVAPFNCEVGEVSIINSTLVSGAATNNVHLNLIDGGPAGAGTAEIAVRDLESGTDLVIGKILLFDNIIGASAERFLTAGDMLELEQEEIGTGLGVGINPFLVRTMYRPANLSA